MRDLIEATFRGQKLKVKAGQTLNVPSNAPHELHNVAQSEARVLYLCSPAGQEEFFARIGTPVATRTTAPPPLSDDEQKQFLAKAQELAPKYRTELLQSAD